MSSSDFISLNLSAAVNRDTSDDDMQFEYENIAVAPSYCSNEGDEPRGVALRKEESGARPMTSSKRYLSERGVSRIRAKSR